MIFFWHPPFLHNVIFFAIFFWSLPLEILHLVDFWFCSFQRSLSTFWPTTCLLQVVQKQSLSPCSYPWNGQSKMNHEWREDCRQDTAMGDTEFSYLTHTKQEQGCNNHFKNDQAWVWTIQLRKISTILNFEMVNGFQWHIST